MKRSALLIAAAVALVAFPAVAQPHGGPGPAADPSQAFDVLGTVISFTAEPGAGTPTLVVDDVALGEIAIRLGPLWLLREAAFTAVPGDQVAALVYPCTLCTVPYVAAAVENLTAGTSVVLRDEDGYPLWMGRRGTGGGRGFCAGPQDGLEEQRGSHGGGGSGAGSGMGSGPAGGQGPGAGSGPGAGMGPGGGPGAGSGPGAGPGAGEGPGAGPGPGAGGYPGGQCQWAGPDMSQAEVLTGTVVSLEVGFGVSHPSVILEVGGEEIEVFLMPYAPLAAAGFLIEPGTELQVVAAPWAAPWGDEVWVAISVTDPATGLTVQLRDPETGYPVTGGGGGFGPGFGYGPGPGGD